MDVLSCTGLELLTSVLQGMLLLLWHFSGPACSRGRMLCNGTLVLSQLEFGF
jgi:hypothetical protein